MSHDTHPRTSRRARRPGQALVEFTMVFGIAMLLIFGITDLFQVLLANYTVNQAARNAAHQAALTGGDVARALGAARQSLDDGIGTRSDQADIDVHCPRTPCRRYDPITVTVIYRDAFWAKLPPLFDTFRVDMRATRAAEKDQQ